MKMPITLPRQVWFAVFGIALLFTLGWVATTSGPLAPIKVTVTQVAKGEVAPALFGIGTVEARRAYLIGPTAAGRVRSVLVDVGDRVKAGQLLAEMDPVDLDARVTSAAAATARAGSAVTTAQAQVNDAKSRQALAASEARRYVDLGHKGFVSQSVVDGKLQQQQSADAQFAAAESALASARQDVGRLDSDREGVKQQRMNIRLEAPADGVVTSRDAEPGSTVVAGQAVLKLVDPASLWVKTRLDQGRSAGLQVGLPAEITLRSKARKLFAGKVVRIEPVSDSVTEERLAQVAFDSLPQGVTTGEMAEVTLHPPAIRDTLLVPNAALRYRGAKAGVWLRADGHLRFVPVKTGAEGLDGKVQIVEGVKAGDEVIVYSESDLKDDSRIKVVASLGGKGK
ncbi:hemolysin secretion protein D [Sulfuricella sp. T08]|uniref:efflux RND transporter periplasmic adaptor subunit n=1 Tax=Sulfuricella sp. T08 TaxID=1632857 RepID=UPI00061798F0|nr:efflux RND transporter periplasmic adaptor subunit [Sulfuricella sp. T08]GAO36245.1 hemolysin secretion protein D [Sulfuricella sp. T08]